MSRDHAMPAARPTPFELIFGPDVFDYARFEQLREQAAARDATTMGELLSLPAGGELLRDAAPDGEGAAHRDHVAQLGALLFHAFRYWLHGRIVYRFDECSVAAVLGDAVGSWSFRAPAPAGYVQLPRNMFWARADAESPAEPADGFFWSTPTADEGAEQVRLDILLALGVRRDRPGLTVVTVSVEAGADPAHWADVVARADGHDFDNILPGGELMGYRALTTHAELLKLAVRALRHIDRHADAISGEAGVFVVGGGNG